MTRNPTSITLALASLAMVSACGGGGGESVDTSLSNEVAQGDAADAASMPVNATAGLEAAATALEAGLNGTVTTAGAERA